MKKSQFIAFIIFLIVVLWIGSGFIFPSDNKSADKARAESTQSSDLTKVKVERLTAQALPQTITFMGRTQASKRIDIRAEVSGQIQTIYFDEGDIVANGKTILRLDIRDRQARVAEAKALVTQRQSEYNTAKALEEKGFGANLRTREALAALQSAKAGLKANQINSSKQSVRASFTGTLTEQFVEQGDFVNIGDALFTLVDLDPMEIVGYVTEKQVLSVKKGDTANVTLLNGDTAQAVVDYISPTADPSTRTFRTILTLSNNDNNLEDGLTAEVSLNVGDLMGYAVRPSALVLDDDGRVGVRIVQRGDSNNAEAIFTPVTIIGEENSKIFITGLPSSINLITVGQAYVGDGTAVDPVYDDIGSGDER